MREIGERFRTAVHTGQVGALQELYAGDASLEGAVPGGDVEAVGPAAIVGELAGWWGGPAQIDEWRLTLGDSAAEFALEWSTAGGVPAAEPAAGGAARLRQRHWIHAGTDGRIRRHFLYSERPRRGLHRVEPGLPAPSFLRDATRRVPIAGEGASGTAIERAVLASGEAVVVKYLSPASSWIMRATNDRGREASLWASGALRGLPPPLEVPVVAAEPHGDGWAVAVRDVTASLIPIGRRISRADARRLLGAADALHRRFEHAAPGDASSLFDRARLYAPRTARTERDGSDLVPKLVGRGWRQFRDRAAAAADEDTAEAVLALVADPAPLVRALEADGTTLIHGDFQHANLGLYGDTVIAIDWGLACAAPAEVELAWYLECGAPATDATASELLADWRALRRDRFDADRLALAFLFQVVLSGWSWALFSVESPFAAERSRSAAALRDWVGRARSALDRWSP